MHFPSQFSDNYYRAELIDALTNSLTPAISINNEVRTVDNLNADVRLILEEITRFLNMEKLLPSYRNTITVRCVSFPIREPTVSNNISSFMCFVLESFINDKIAFNLRRRRFPVLV